MCDGKGIFAIKPTPIKRKRQKVKLTTSLNKKVPKGKEKGKSKGKAKATKNSKVKATKNSKVKVAINSKVKKDLFFQGSSIGGSFCILTLLAKNDLSNYLDLLLTFGIIIGVDNTGTVLRKSLPLYPAIRLEFNKFLFQPLFPTQPFFGPLVKIHYQGLLSSIVNADTSLLCSGLTKSFMFTESYRKSDMVSHYVPAFSKGFRKINIILKCSFNNTGFVYINILVFSTVSPFVITGRLIPPFVSLFFFFPPMLTLKSLKFGNKIP